MASWNLAAVGGELRQGEIIAIVWAIEAYGAVKWRGIVGGAFWGVKTLV
ncbi:hypothetical protein [Bartonella tribocorum]|nr:hypothetical protein [Bartonella tribocorum]